MIDSLLLAVKCTYVVALLFATGYGLAALVHSHRRKHQRPVRTELDDYARHLRLDDLSAPCPGCDDLSCEGCGWLTHDDGTRRQFNND